MNDFTAYVKGSLSGSAVVDRDAVKGFPGQLPKVEEGQASFSQELTKAQDHRNSKQGGDDSAALVTDKPPVSDKLPTPAPTGGAKTPLLAAGLQTEPLSYDGQAQSVNQSAPVLSLPDEPSNRLLTTVGLSDTTPVNVVDSDNDVLGSASPDQGDAAPESLERLHQVVGSPTVDDARDTSHLAPRTTVVEQPNPAVRHPTVEQDTQILDESLKDLPQAAATSLEEPELPSATAAVAGDRPDSSHLPVAIERVRPTLETPTVNPGVSGQAAPTGSATELPKAENVPGGTLPGLLANARVFGETLSKPGPVQLMTGPSVIKLGETVTSSVIANQMKQRAGISAERLPNGGLAEPLVGGAIADMKIQDASLPGQVSNKQPAHTGTDDSLTLKALVMEESRSMQARFSTEDTLKVMAGKTSFKGATELSASELQASKLTALSARLGSVATPVGVSPIDSDMVNPSTTDLSPDGLNTLKSVANTNGFNVLNASAGPVTGISLPDNMLADSSSGIVTAPQLARTDAVNNTVINAPLSVPLMLPAANEAMASNISWMVKEGVQNATVSVMPAGMGPISVKIGIENEQMNVSIVATQGSTRDALEAMLPRLREQLLTQGLDSVRVDISDSKPEGSRGNGSQSQPQDRQSADSGQNFQQGAGQSSERGGDKSRHDTADAAATESGERELSDAERGRLEKIMPETLAGSTPVTHGYDLYV